MNQVGLFGRLTRDPELRYTQNGKAVVNFSLAVNRYSDNEADFFDCVAFDKQAENIANSCRKGHRLLVWGRLQQDRWTDQQGQNRSAVKIILSGFSFIEPPPQQQNQQPPTGQPQYQGQPQGYQQPPTGYPGYQQPPHYPPAGQPGYVPPTSQPPYQGQSPAGPPNQPPQGQIGFQFPGQAGGYQGNLDDIPF